MKRLLSLFLTMLLSAPAYSQALVDFSKFPNTTDDTTALSTSVLLDKLDWESIKRYSIYTDNHRASEISDNLFIIYEYSDRTKGASFRITSYRGVILKYYADSSSAYPMNKILYFNKKIWLNYTNDILPSLPDEFKLSMNEPNNILRAYYKLVGVDSGDEYGFICEYSTVGMPPIRRGAVITLLQHQRIDLIRNLMKHPNIQTRMYAIDAMIYSSSKSNHIISQLNKNIRKSKNTLSRRENKDTQLINHIKTLSDSISILNYNILSKDEWISIHNLRDSKLRVKTCGNAGSYKVYETPISELLSDKSINQILKWYESFERTGYFLMYAD